MEKVLDLVASLDRKSENLLGQLAETTRRLSDIERKVEDVSHFREKFLEWMAQYSRRFEEVRGFRDESRASLEAVFCKLEDLDQDIRLLKAAVRDVDRRTESLQKRPDPATFGHARGHEQQRPEPSDHGPRGGGGTGQRQGAGESLGESPEGQPAAPGALTAASQ